MKLLFILLTTLISIHASTQLMPAQIDTFQTFMQENCFFFRENPCHLIGFCNAFKQEESNSKLKQQQKIDQAFRLLAIITKYFYWTCDEVVRDLTRREETFDHKKFEAVRFSDFEQYKQAVISPIFTIFQIMVNQLLKQGKKIPSNQARMRECQSILTLPYGTSVPLGIAWLTDSKGIIPFPLEACLNLENPKVYSRRQEGEPKTLKAFHEMALPFLPLPQLYGELYEVVITATSEVTSYPRYLYFKYGEIITSPGFLVSLDNDFVRFIYHHGAPNFTKERASMRLPLSLLQEFGLQDEFGKDEFFMETPQTDADLQFFNVILLEELLGDDNINTLLLKQLTTPSTTKEKDHTSDNGFGDVTEKTVLPLTKEEILKQAYENAIQVEQEMRMKMVGENAIPGKQRNRKGRSHLQKASGAKQQHALAKTILPEELRKKREEGRVKFKKLAKLVSSLLKEQIKSRQFEVVTNQNDSHINFHFDGIDALTGQQKSCGITLVAIHKRKKDRTITTNEANDFMDNVRSLCRTFAIQS